MDKLGKDIHTIHRGKGWEPTLCGICGQRVYKPYGLWRFDVATGEGVALHHGKCSAAWSRRKVPDP